MKKVTMIGYITLAISALVHTSIEYTVAEQADVTTRQCLVEVIRWYFY